MIHIVEQRTDEDEAIAEVNDKFHKGVLEACGNPRLRDLLGAITEVPLQLSTFRRYSVDELRRSAACRARRVTDGRRWRLGTQQKNHPKPHNTTYVAAGPGGDPRRSDRLS